MDDDEDDDEKEVKEINEGFDLAKMTTSDKSKFLVLVDELIDQQVFFHFHTGWSTDENDDGRTYMAMIQVLHCEDTFAVHEILKRLNVKSKFSNGWILYAND